MSQVFLSPKEDLKQCAGTVATLKDWQSRNWAIGLNYSGNHQPDGFFVFFANRGLNFEAYLRSGDLSTGNSSAYDTNITTLNSYATGVYNDEVAAVDNTIATLKDWQSKNWAIGLSYSACQPDGFARFFSQRGLPIAYYVVGHCTYGDPSAYGVNIQTLENYKASLSKPV